MDRSQWYIGAKNGVVVCIDMAKGFQICGRFYHRYEEKAVFFFSTEQFLFQMEHFLDSLRFPHSATEGRTFRKEGAEKEKNQKRAVKMSDKELLQKHGELGTFIVRIQHRQNSSWQGRITWMEQDKTLCFRSIWEMLKLIATVVEPEDGQEQNEEELPGFF